MKAMVLRLLLLIAACMIAAGLSAQSLSHSLVARGGRENRRDASYIAYLDTVRNVARIYPDFAHGQTLKGDCIAVDEWCGVVFFQMRDRCYLGSKERGIFNNEGLQYRIVGENLLLISIGYVHFYQKGFQKRIVFANPPRENFTWSLEDTVGGRPVFCLADYNQHEYFTASELRNWGMLTADGSWLIQPIYDAPFHFKNGIAEVTYYGEKRKINEQGEFVE